MSALAAFTLRRAFSTRLGPTAAARLTPLAPRAPALLGAPLSTSSIVREEDEHERAKRRAPGPSAFARGGSRAAFARPHTMRQADKQPPPEETEEEVEEEVRDAIYPVMTRNHDIPFKTVQLVGEDKKLSEPLPLGPIIDAIDLDTESVICLQSDPPVVKIVNNADERQKERERGARIRLSKRLAVEDKELQMGWGAADGDVHHKIDTAVELLKKGDRVHIVFALRANSGGKKQRVPDERKMQILEMFEDGVADVAKKWKDDEQNRGLWIQHWTPKESVITEARAKIVLGGVEKRKVRDERKEARRLKEEERARKAKERQAKEMSKAM